MPVFISFAAVLHILLLHQLGSSNPLTSGNIKEINWESGARRAREFLYVPIDKIFFIPSGYGFPLKFLLGNTLCLNSFLLLPSIKFERFLFFEVKRLRIYPFLINI